MRWQIKCWNAVGCRVSVGGPAILPHNPNAAHPRSNSTTILHPTPKHYFSHHHTNHYQTRPYFLFTNKKINPLAVGRDSWNQTAVRYLGTLPLLRLFEHYFSHHHTKFPIRPYFLITNTQLTLSLSEGTRESIRLYQTPTIGKSRLRN